MQIRTKLTFWFLIIVACILFAGSISIYFFSANYRREEFYERLKNKAFNTAKLLIEVDEVDVSLLKKLETDNPISLPEEKIVIINYKDEIIFSTDENHFIKFDKQLINEIRLKEEIRFRQKEYEFLGFLYKDKFDRFTIITGARDIYGYTKLKNLRTILFVVFGTSIIIVLISGWLYAGKALMPISKVVMQVNNISASSLNLRVDKGKENDEISKLATTFNQMLDRIEIAFKSQKNFIANASHELRTPLTAITSEIEVNLMKNRTASEYKNALISVLDDMQKLNQISNRLLLLAQADSTNSDKDFKTLRIDELLWNVRSELLKRHDNYSINISFDSNVTNENQMAIKGNEQLLKIAISNLIDNGCKYSVNHTSNIIIANDQNNLKIFFNDNGMGIDESDILHIFEPFYRGKNAQNAKGYGIGLSLAEKIVKLHNGKIDVESQIDKGTKFTLKFTRNNF